MIVTEVRRKGNKVFVNFDNNEQMIIPYEVFVHNYLSKNDKLLDKQKEELEKKVEIYKIKQSSFRYLSGRNHSKYELRIKLMKKKYDTKLISSVLHDLERQELINDSVFAAEYFNSQLQKKKGLMKIKSDLARKGVNREIIDLTLSQNSYDDVFLESAKLLADRKCELLMKRNLEGNIIKQKVYQFLAGRGFTSDIIRETINKMEF